MHQRRTPLILYYAPSNNFNFMGSSDCDRDETWIECKTTTSQFYISLPLEILVEGVNQEEGIFRKLNLIQEASKIQNYQIGFPKAKEKYSKVHIYK